MDPATALAIVQLLRMLIEDGIPAVAKLMEVWQKQDPTLSDFEALRALMKRPEDYLKED